MKTGIGLITEAKNKMEMKGYTSETDQQYKDNSLAKVAACYAMPEDEREKYQSFTFTEPKMWFPRWWPRSWDVKKYWKPQPNNRIEELSKAGAFIAAEIDRLINKK